MISAFVKIILGETLLPQKRHHEYGAFFEDLDYTCLPPYSQLKVLKTEILMFYRDKGESGHDGFDLDGVEDVFTVCTLDDGKIVFAASFFVTDVGRMKIGYITNMKTKEEHRKQGLASGFLEDLRAFMGVGLTEAYQKAFIVLNAAQQLKKYYVERGFEIETGFLNPWQLKDHTLMKMKIKDDDDNMACDPSKFSCRQSNLEREYELECELCFSRYGEIWKQRCCGRYCHTYCNEHELFKKMFPNGGHGNCVFCGILGKAAKAKKDAPKELKALQGEEEKKRPSISKHVGYKRIVAQRKESWGSGEDEENGAEEMIQPKKVNNGGKKQKEEAPKKRDLKKKENIPSDAKSDRSGNRNADKHCLEEECNGKRISGANMARHLLDIHGDKAPNTIEMFLCYQGDCCNRGLECKTVKGKKHYLCGVCHQFTRYDLFTKKKGRCKKKCQPFLSQETFENLPLKKQAIADRIMRLEVPEELEQYLEYQEATEVATSAFGSISVAGFETSEGFLVLLKDIENGKKEEYLAIQHMITHCQMFLNDTAINFLAVGEHVVLSRLLLKVIEAFLELNQEQVCGMLLASILLNGPCWKPAQKAGLKCFQRFEYSQTLLKGHLSRVITDRYSRWLCGNWSTVSSDQIKLIKYLVAANNGQASLQALNFALVIKNPPSETFVAFVEDLSQLPSASVISKCIETNPFQPKMEEATFYTLCDIIRSEHAKRVISQLQDELLQIPLLEWAAFFQEKQQAANVVDSSNVMEFFGKLSSVYGQNAQLTDNLVDPEYPDSRFFSLMHELPVKPNNRQFAVAQYCIGRMQSEQRQAWIVPSGQGKSRITAATAAIALLVEAFTKVHLVFENQYLLGRDRQDFEHLWLLLGYTEGIEYEYHVGIAFDVKPGELLIIDEADCFMFKQSEQFMKLIKESACICFTATPDNQDPNGVEAKLLKAFGIAKYNYMVGGVNDEEEEKQKKFLALNISRNLQKEVAATASQKVSLIQQKNQEGPVLVFCTEEFKKALEEQSTQVVCIEPGKDIDSAFLRRLDQVNEEKFYPLVVSTSTFGMRVKSFDTERDALQGLNRVGRFGDSCTRTIFSDIPLVDERASLTNKGKIMKFLVGVDKHKVQVKQVKVKELVTKASKNSGARNQKRANQLVASSSQLQISHMFGQQ